MKSTKEFYRNISRDIVDSVFPDLDPAKKGRIMRMLVKKLSDRLAIMTMDITEFHEKFGLAYAGPPRELDPELHKFRSKFMQEELDEYNEAHAKGDLHGQFDALIDLAYVLLGTAHLQGLPFAEGWNRVHTANMAKVRAERSEDSKRGSTFDVVKPEGWTAPDLSDLLPTPGSAQGRLL
jgi:predicted HAD superfamily Cof-like phosphohydrolase